jgi:hypothetical protein
VILHLKWHPTFVSDATLPDLLHFIGLLGGGGHSAGARALGQRLETAFVSGRLRFAPDPFWNSSRFLWELPLHLARLFETAALVIVKGDANYRRSVGDTIWSADTVLKQVLASFPAPVLLLRTMKSDPLVGLSPETAAELDGLDGEWRVNGRRGVIQASW